MRRSGLLVLPVLVIAAILLFSREARSDNEPGSTFITLMPAKWVSVEGDREKFEAINWMGEGYSGGIKDFSGSYRASTGLNMSFGGHAISNDDDIGANITLSDKDLGELLIDYKTFKKYYDGSGGYYKAFYTLYSVDLDKDLNMDMGDLLIEFTPALENNDNEIVLSYERRSKNGNKSRLNWSEVEEAVSGLTRNIAPTWQEVDEVEDVFTIKGSTILAGFDVTGEQRFETVNSSLFREEKDVSTTSTAADKTIRRQTQEPGSKELSTTIQAEKWFDDNRSYVSFGYRYESIENDEQETIFEYNAAGVKTNLSSYAEQKPNAYAHNQMDAHTLIGQCMRKITPALSLSTKVKSEFMNRDGESIYPDDRGGAVPDGVYDSIEYNDTRNTALSFGETFSLRYSGFERTSVYADAEFGQVNNDLSEEQHNISRTLLWDRDTKTFTTSSLFSLGTRTILTKTLSLTAQLKRLNKSDDYDHKKKNRDSGINSAFFDSLKESEDKSIVKLNWKPTRKVQNSLRYQFSNRLFESRVETQDDEQSRTVSHMVTYDVTLQPKDDLLFNIALSNQDMNVSTGASSMGGTGRTPGFNADVQSALVGASYFPNEDLSYTANFSISRSDNFDDFSTIGLPLGVSNTHYDLRLGAVWKPKGKDFTVEPHYSYYQYDTDTDAEFGEYKAHVAWIDLDFKW